MTDGPPFDVLILAGEGSVQVPDGIETMIVGDEDFAWRNALPPGFAAEMRKVREDIRRDEGADGQCGWVCEVVAPMLGATAIIGAYLDQNGDPISGEHIWLELPGGSWLDPTSDQFGEGHDMRLIPVGSAFRSMFRSPHWNESYYPGHPQGYPELEGVEWSGEIDEDWCRRLVVERGEGWWLRDERLLKAYLERRLTYEGSLPGEGDSVDSPLP